MYLSIRPSSPRPETPPNIIIPNVIYVPQPGPQNSNDTSFSARAWFCGCVYGGMTQGVQTIVATLVIGLFNELLSKVIPTPQTITTSCENNEHDQRWKVEILSGDCPEAICKDGTINPQILKMLERAEERDPNYPSYIKGVALLRDQFKQQQSLLTNNASSGTIPPSTKGVQTT